MTKGKHATLDEFRKTWNLSEEDAKIRMYNLVRENWISRRKLLYHNVAIANIKELIIEGTEEKRDPKDVMNDILTVIANLHDREVNHARW